ncbi:MAG: polysaccharide biosynthesis tyrosine autokinase [Phycisphaerales bacterium]|nr:polysaccharide biosynthesis tyrosine autokinase [Phycisphaerales bacterium]
MTSIPAPARLPGPPARSAAPAAPAVVATIDPVKMFRKYKWVLAITAVLGIVLGGGLHFAWMNIYPMYSARTIFQVFAVQADPTAAPESQMIDDVAFERFMQTQRSIMTSELVLQKLAEDRRLPTEAPAWSSGFVEGNAFNSAEAAEELKNMVSARLIPQTRFIAMEVGWKNRQDVTAIVKLWRETYQTELQRQVRESSASQREAVLGAIDTLNTQVNDAQARRRKLLVDNNVDVITKQSTDSQQQLSVVNSQLVNVLLDLEALRTRFKNFENELANPGGINYGEALRDDVMSMPEIQSIKQTITSLESQRQALLLKYTMEHRLIRELNTQLTGYNASLETKVAELLDQRFRAMVDSTRMGVSQLEAQQAELTNKQNNLTERLRELTKTQAELDDIDRAVQLTIESKSKMELRLQELNALQSLDSFMRVQVFQQERVPNEVSFPKLKFMLPAGLFLSLMLVSGFLVGKELLDTRIKGPSDVAMIPRARVLGLVPAASEDPSAPGAVETAFRDRPKGVIAESFRQVRSTLSKRMDLAAHKTLVVIAATPGSGATSVVANLALVGAAAGQRVLVIDANMRRPALHRIFGVNEGPGLGDVITGSAKIEGAVQRAGDDRLHVLAAGSRDFRAGELLATDGMTKLIRQAREMYDVVLIDVAPALVSGDSMAIANRCDSSMLVVKAMSETRGMVARLINDLNDARAEMLGVLVNGVRSSAGGYLRSNIKATHDYLNT